MTAYEQAQAKLRELAALVEAGTPGPWERDRRIMGLPVDLLPGFVALCESVLSRHTDLGPGWCAWCAENDTDDQRWPCPDARAVLTALGVLDRLGTAEGESR